MFYNLSEIQNGRCCPISPLVTALWTCISHLPETVHNRLKNGCKWSHTYSCSNKDSMLCVENLTGWCTEWSVKIYLRYKTHFNNYKECNEIDS